MLKYERTALRGVTLETGSILAEQLNAAPFDFLGQTCSASFDGSTGVRIVAIRATHFSFQHRVMVRHFKSGAYFQVTLEAGVRRSPGIDDLTFIAAASDVQTSRTVARFAAHLLGVVAGRF